MASGGNSQSMAKKPLEMSGKSPEISKFFLEMMPRQAGEKRGAWFSRLSRVLGIQATRLRDLYYDPRCKMWAEELATIQQKRRVCLEQQLSELQDRQALVAARLRSMGNIDNENNSDTRGTRRRRGCVSVPDSGCGADVLR